MAKDWSLGRKDRMRIGLVVPGFSADAGDWCIPALRNLVARLAIGDGVRVFALRYPHKPGRYDLFGARVTALGGGARTGPGSAGLWARAASRIAREHLLAPFDVLHAFWAGETGALTALVGRALRVPVVVSLAGGELAGLAGIGYGGRLAPTERLKTRLALRLAARVTAGSRFLLRAARSHARSGIFALAPFGVDTGMFGAPRFAGPSGPPRLVQAASLVPVKDQATLLRATGLLRERGADFRLEIAGAGPLEGDLRRLAEGLGGRVALLGDVPHHGLPAFYAGAAGYVQSSLHEAQGMALLEAAACGVPAAGTRVGVLPELEPDAAVGCAPGDAEGLAAAIAALLERGARRAMGASARETVESEYSMERCVERFRSIYDELV